MSEKHFNKGVIFGRLVGVEKKTSEGGRKYLQLQFECPNMVHGDAKVFGRMWGEERIEPFLKELKDERGVLMMGAKLKMEGFYNQYDGDGQRLSSYTLYKWAFYEGNEFRATFILRGVVEDVYENDEGEGVLHLHLSRPGNNEQTVEEDFLLYAEDPQILAGVSPGQTVHVKGVIAEQGEEDYFGETSGVFKPYIKVIEIKEGTNGTN